MLRCLSSCSAVLVLLACCGCGGGDEPVPVAVSGNVSFKGQPVTQGVVFFMSDQGFGASAEIDAQGRYVIRSQYGKGIPAGTYRVSVTPPPEAANESDAAPISAAKETHPEIPPKYRDFSTSGLTVDLGDKPMVFDIQMQAK